MDKLIEIVKQSRNANNETQAFKDNKFIYNSTFCRMGNDAFFSLCNFHSNNFQSNSFEYYSIDYPSEIRRSVQKRQAEYLAGRYCAIESLNRMGLKIDNFQGLPIGKQRSPYWPKGVLGSITHTEDTAMSIVAKEQTYSFVGIDYERIMNHQLAMDIYTSIISKQEFKYICSIEVPLNILVTLVFSAKETIFKALYKYVQDYFGFEEAFIQNINTERQLINIMIRREFAEKHQIPASYSLKYCVLKTHILTVLLSKAVFEL